MEVSAHALFYRKDEGFPYTACVFTNFTQVTSIFSVTMQKYKEAKKLLFAADKCPLAILNGDDAVGREIGGERSKRIGRENADDISRP